jgi:hypothetical protein
MLPKSALSLALSLLPLSMAVPGFAQQTCLPAPRLLTIAPMGGQAGTTLEVDITHQNIETARELLFSTPKITAKPVVTPDGKTVPNKFLVTIAPDAPVGVHDARILSKMGLSAPRAFSVDSLPEVTRSKPNTKVENAWALQPNSICNATASPRAVDYYSFQGIKGRRILVQCNAARVDSKLSPVVIVADAKGDDLVVSRTSGVLEFTPPADGPYLIKVHDLTFKGGNEHFYRLALREVQGSSPVLRPETTARASSFSWPPEGLPKDAPTHETEPNNTPSQAQKISLPCDLSGNFSSANDLDVFEFQAKKGEVWWVEVASERLGLNTDPSVLIQRVTKTGNQETLTDAAELEDIPSPMKMGTYVAASRYDGPHHQAGSPDVLGKFEAKEDGTYRLLLKDLVRGSRREAEGAYRLVIRKANPDFAVVAWAAHQVMRQNDWGTVPKPIALRAGITMAFEVVTVRRDGFNGEIEIGMEDLPPGVTASGLTIPAGALTGMLFITADENAVPAHSIAKIFGRAQINGTPVTRPGRLATVVWPVDYAPNEYPKSRLTADVPVSVTDYEKATLSIAADGNKTFQATVGQTLKIPLRITWRNEFNGASMNLKPYGSTFRAMKDISLPIKAGTSEAVVDLAALKTPPGDYNLTFSGIGVTKYRPNPEVLKNAAEEQKKASEEVAALTAAAKAAAEKVATVPPAEKAEATNASKIATQKQKAAETALAEANKRLKSATDADAPKDILDFVVSEPIQISVRPAVLAQAPAASTNPAPAAPAPAAPKPAPAAPAASTNPAPAAPAPAAPKPAPAAPAASTNPAPAAPAPAAPKPAPAAPAASTNPAPAAPAPAAPKPAPAAPAASTNPAPVAPAPAAPKPAPAAPAASTNPAPAPSTPPTPSPK